MLVIAQNVVPLQKERIMAEKFKTFSGNRLKVEEEFNEFLENVEGTYSRIVMTGNEDNLVLGVTYSEKESGTHYYF